MDMSINISWYLKLIIWTAFSCEQSDHISWDAVKKWNCSTFSYLAEMVGNQELFLSTYAFSTLEKTVLGQFADDEVYCGIINDPTLAVLVARDYIPLP